MIKQLALCTLIASATLIAPYASAADQSGSKLEAAFKKADKDGAVSEKEIHDYMKAQHSKK
jgi:hypothetical protein